MFVFAITHTRLCDRSINQVPSHQQYKYNIYICIYHHNMRWVRSNNVYSYIILHNICLRTLINQRENSGYNLQYKVSTHSLKVPTEYYIYISATDWNYAKSEKKTLMWGPKWPYHNIRSAMVWYANRKCAWGPFGRHIAEVLTIWRNMFLMGSPPSRSLEQ